MKAKLLLSAAALTLLAAACKNDDDPVTPATAGKGGHTTLRIMSQHHHPPAIDSITVYIKYNASNLPLTFDDSARAVKGAVDTVATFTGLKNGNYYLYGLGWDRSIADTVMGGIPYTINVPDTSVATTINLTLPVTEGD